MHTTSTRIVLASVLLVALVSCGSDEPTGGGPIGGSAGSSGSGGSGGVAGSGADAGSGGDGGSAGSGGSGGRGGWTIDSDTGTFIHGAAMTLQGSGFGTKTAPAPFRSSYHHPTVAQNFQQTGALDGTHWAGTASVLSVEEGLPGVRVTGHDSHRYYVRLEYSDRGNWGGDGYSAGLQTDLEPSDHLYFAWWDYFEPGFDASHMETGAANFKWTYNSPGQPTHQAISVVDGGSNLHTSFAGGVGGATDAEQDANLILPFGGGYYGRPLSFRPSFALPIGQWYLVELLYEWNTGPGAHDGWHEMRVDNELVYRANAVDFQDPSDPGHFEFMRYGGNYGFDDSGEVYFRQYGDLYVDTTFARIVLCESPSYDECSHVEVQVPTTWTATELGFTLNHGSFMAGDTVHVHVFDEGDTHVGSAPLALE